MGEDTARDETFAGMIRQSTEEAETMGAIREGDQVEILFGTQEGKTGKVVEAGQRFARVSIDGNIFRIPWPMLAKREERTV